MVLQQLAWIRPASGLGLVLGRLSIDRALRRSCLPPWVQPARALHSARPLLTPPPSWLGHGFGAGESSSDLSSARLRELERGARTDATLLPQLYRAYLADPSGLGSERLVTHYERLGPSSSGLPGTRAGAAGVAEEVFSLYLTALGRLGRVDRVTEAVRQHLPGVRASSNGAGAGPLQDPDTPVLGGRLASALRSATTLHVRPTVGARGLGSRASRHASPASASSSHEAPWSGGSADAPLRVTVSEAWSWSKITRSTLSTLMVTLLLLTGTQMVMDAQGITRPVAAEVGIESHPTVRFADVQGVDEAKAELEEIVEYLRNPKKFSALGGKLPKGVLLHGPPGTGKTMLARAIAGEAGVPFFQMSGSEFEEMFVGLGAKRVRELFAMAKRRAPCIVFIDEIDAVGSKRNPKDGSHMRQTLNQLLTELDGFKANEGVIFICATNTPNTLDKALLRPGRIDARVPVSLPDITGRAKILQAHMRNVRVAKDVDPMIIARGTPGFSGADLANVVNQAALKASKEHCKLVDMRHMEWAKDKIIMGVERRSALITPEDKRLTAYHEAGHTLVALYTDATLPLHKVSVIPRGNALGVTVQLPDRDMNSLTKRELLARLDVCMGGRVAEELIFGADAVTTGASNDLEQATLTAQGMVRRYGMSERAGLAGLNDELFQALSEQGKQVIEGEVNRMLKEANDRVVQLLRSKQQELHRLAGALMEYETLDGEEVQRVVRGDKLTRSVAL